MVQRVQYMLVDDTDGSQAAESVKFGLDGVSYEIDLSQSNADKLRRDLAAWVGNARRSGGRKTTGRRSPGTAPRRGDLGAVRAWARANGHQVSDRGRISAVVQEAYDRAHAE